MTGSTTVHHMARRVITLTAGASNTFVASKRPPRPTSTTHRSAGVSAKASKASTLNSSRMRLGSGTPSEALATTAGEVPLAFALAAGSFRDGTRVAATAPDLVRAMCEANADEPRTGIHDRFERTAAEGRGFLQTTDSYGRYTSGTVITASSRLLPKNRRRAISDASGSNVVTLDSNAIEITRETNTVKIDGSAISLV